MGNVELRDVMDRLEDIEAKVDQVLKTMLAQSGGDVADDRDLDSEWGDPTIKFDMPDKDWQGPSMAGKRFSQCSVEWLDAKAKSDASYAEYLRGPKKGTDEDLKKAAYRDKDAARARGWAKRLRGGWRPAGAARSHGATTRPATAPSPAGYGQGAPCGYGGGVGYGGGGATAAPTELYGRDGKPFADDDVPFISCAFDPLA